MIIDGRVREPQSPAEMQGLTSDEIQLLNAQRNEEGARRTLIESLIKMGRFEEALALENIEEEKSRIQQFITAEARDDDHRCNCEAYLDHTDYIRTPNGPQDLRRTPHYIRTSRHWSSKYNAFVWFYRCKECGCVQSLPDGQSIDELHDQNYAARTEILQTHIKQGVPMRTLQRTLK